MFAVDEVNVRMVGGPSFGHQLLIAAIPVLGALLVLLLGALIGGRQWRKQLAEDRDRADRAAEHERSLGLARFLREERRGSYRECLVALSQYWNASLTLAHWMDVKAPDEVDESQDRLKFPDEVSKSQERLSDAIDEAQVAKADVALVGTAVTVAAFNAALQVLSDIDPGASVDEVKAVTPAFKEARGHFLDVCKEEMASPLELTADEVGA